MKKNQIEYICEYCCGCGLCSSMSGIHFKLIDGFWKPCIENNKGTDIFEKICPSLTTKDRRPQTHICGDFRSVFLGCSSNKLIRNAGSSGGVLTSLAVYMLENKIVDGVLHVGEDKNKPWRASFFCSSTKEEVISKAGSRYAQALTLSSIEKYLSDGKKYLLIAKPCDIRAMRNLSNIDPRVNKSIPYMFSFFCMGTPSENANLALINALNCSEEDCVSLRYRGDGWPGYARIELSDGTYRQMTYNDSWGNILGRDLRKYCRFCMDGFGDAADIACGDAWYLNDINEPDFSEHPGRNVIFARNERGARIIEGAYEKRYIEITDFSSQIDLLKNMQKAQYIRKSTMAARQLAMKVLGKKSPRYSRAFLKSFSKESTWKRKIGTFLGMLSRVLNGKI